MQAGVCSQVAYEIIGQMAPILVNDLRRHSLAVAADVRLAVERVIDRGWYVLGSECADFEKAFADYCGVQYCVGVANGTDALELAFRALGIGRGTRVATVANAGFYATAALRIVGAQPVFVDVETDSKLMDLGLLRRVTEAGDVEAIVVTHLFGLMHDVLALEGLARRAGIPLIEDCAQAHGARRAGVKAGSRGDIGCFSFYPTKNLGGIGDGGAVVTSNRDLFERLKSLRQYGWEVKYRVTGLGGRNSRLDEIQAAVLNAKLPCLDGWNARRRDIATRYSSAIHHPRITCPPVRGEEYVAHLYVITCRERVDLQNHLAAAGISSDIHYPLPDHLQPVMNGISHLPHLPVTEQLADHILTLPCFPELTDAEVDQIVTRVNCW